MNRIRSQLLPILAMLSIGAASHAQMVPAQQLFNVNDPVGRDFVAFESSALLESTTGHGTDIKGQISVNPMDPGSVRALLRLSIASIRTGIEDRDKNLASSEWIDTSKFPDAIFKVDSATGMSMGWLDDRQTLTATALGSLTILGHTEPMTMQVRVSYMKESAVTSSLAPGDLLKVEALFKIDLARFGLDAAAKAPNKLSNELNVKAVIVGSTKYPAPEGATLSGGRMSSTPTPNAPKPENAAPPPAPK